MTPHFHFGAATFIAGILVSVIVYGSLHMLAAQHDNRWSRAWVGGLGF